MIYPDSDYTNTSTILFSYLFISHIVCGMSEQNGDFFFFIIIYKSAGCPL